VTRDRHETTGGVQVATGARGVIVGGAHLAVLSSFALAQPLFDLLSRHSEFFAVRDLTSPEIVMFAVVLTFGPPMALLALELLAWLLDPRLQRVLHLVLIAGLSGAFFIQALEKTFDLSSAAALIGIAALLGALLAVAYARVRAIRSFLTALLPAPLVFLLLFLFVSPVSKLVLTEEAEARLATVSADAPVVFVVFDEFPVTSIMGPDGDIDSIRFPNFARLSEEATWFRNTTTVDWFTTRAVPSILTGRYPGADELPIASDHPENVFTLLGGRYRLNVSESQTRVCPPQLCRNVKLPGTAGRARSLYSDVGIVYLHLVAPPEYEARLPAITDQWTDFGDAEHEAARKALLEQASRTDIAAPRPDRKNFYEGRVQQFERFVQSIRASSARPRLDFLHVLLPHGPLQYFPSGSQSALADLAPPGRRGDTWADRWLALQAYERHLLQAQFVDALLGKLLDRLQRLGVYDESLVVVTADHGISFRDGDHRRNASATNLQDLAFVPLFVKRPRQRHGDVVDRHLQTVDILPTIADALDVRIPWPVDGRSAFGPAPAPRTVTLGDHSAEIGSLLELRATVLARQIRLFGSGADSATPLQVGPHRELIGRQAGELPEASASGTTAAVDEIGRKLLRALPADPAFVPSPLQGTLAGAGATAGRPIAVALAGKVVAVCASFESAGRTRFSALVPESAFRPGRNRLELFWIGRGPAGLELERIALS
jgi:Sulfatase